MLRDVSIEWNMSAPGELTCTVDALTSRQKAHDGKSLFLEWSTFIYAEEDDKIKFGGVLTSNESGDEGERSFVFTSFSGYPTGRIFLAHDDDPEQAGKATALRYYETDAFIVIRKLWNYLQGTTNGNIGVNVSNNLAGHDIGSADPGSRPVRRDKEDKKDYEKRVTAWQSAVNEPYEIAWWNTPDIGNEIDNILAEAGAEYIEEHSWSDPSTKEVVQHNIYLNAGNPGANRNDLRFVEGENILVPPPVSTEATAYANFVRAIGAGEDRHTLSKDAYADDGRLRRDMIAASKGLYDPKQIKQLANDTLAIAQDASKYDTLEVYNHPNAPIGSWSLGDEIIIQTHSQFVELNERVRIVGWAMSPDEPDTAVLEIMRLV